MKQNHHGFTLLEVLIVLFIMAILTVYSTQSIQQAVRSKQKIDSQTSEFSQVRDALKIIERDVNLAFHYVDLEEELKRKIREERKKILVPTVMQRPSTPPTSPPSTVPPANASGLDANGCYGPNDPLCVRLENRLDPTTHFIGNDNSVSFVTLNASRLREDQPQADFIKVGYALRSCRKPGESSQGSNCLLRRSSPVVEGDVTKGGEEIILLQNIEEFSLRYIGRGKQDWVTTWSSLQGDAATKDKFPEAVEISVTVAKGEGEQKKKISMQIVATVRFPNNTTSQQETNPANNPFGVPAPNNNPDDGG